MKHLSRHRVYIQGDLAPLHGIRSWFVLDVVDLGREDCEEAKETHHQPIFEGIEAHILALIPQQDRVSS